MRKYRVTFKGVFKSKQIAPFCSETIRLGDVIAEVPVYGFFLCFRREEVENELIVHTWHEVAKQYNAYGYRDVFVEEI
jgi:hypothetical protein